MELEEIQSLEKVSLTSVPPHHRRIEVQASEPALSCSSENSAHRP